MNKLKNMMGGSGAKTQDASSSASSSDIEGVFALFTCQMCAAQRSADDGLHAQASSRKQHCTHGYVTLLTAPGTIER
jgi:hypothetical protein